MCVIAVTIDDNAESLSYKEAKDMWDQNPHGGGICYVKKGEDTPTVFKTMVFDHFWKEYKKNCKGKRNLPIMVHMRIATQGSTKPENNHPFQIDQHTYMAHNGILRGLGIGKPLPEETDEDLNDKTDSQLLIERVLRFLPETWLDNPVLVDMVEDYIGNGNKLVFLTTNPKLNNNVYILNMHRGIKRKDRGLWFSNGNHIKRSKVQYTSHASMRTKLTSPVRSLAQVAKDADDKKDTKKKTTLTAVKVKEITESRKEQNYNGSIRYSLAMQRWICNLCETACDNDGTCACYILLDENCWKLLNACRCKPADRIVSDDWAKSVGADWDRNKRKKGTHDLTDKEMEDLYQWM